MVNKCEECGCICKKCIFQDHDVHLHVEIENLKQKLIEREHHIVTMETNFLNEANRCPGGELGLLKDELLTWQDKYRRLYDAHRRVQRVNQGLEDKLLKLVDACETEKSTLTKDVATLSQKLAEANYLIKKLAEDNERYKNDVSLAIQFLQCKQSNFVAQRYDSLPQEVQSQVSSFMTNKRKPEEKKISYEMKSIKVPIPTFPPTAMVYSVPKSPKSDRNTEPETEQPPPVDIVSAAIMARVLEERQKNKAFAKHCDTCRCSKKLNVVYEVTYCNVSTQTSDHSNSHGVKCNENARNDAKNVSNEPTDTTQINGNVAKVQPNNFLTDEIKPQSEATNPDFFSTNEVRRAKCGARRVAQGGCRNILFDNAHAVAASYRHHRIKQETSSSGGFRNDEGSLDSQQKVVEWIKNNLEQEVGSSDNSQSARLDRVKYMEMEENVKRFLFGNSEFLRNLKVREGQNGDDRVDNNVEGGADKQM